MTLDTRNMIERFSNLQKNMLASPRWHKRGHDDTLDIKVQRDKRSVKTKNK